MASLLRVFPYLPASILCRRWTLHHIQPTTVVALDVFKVLAQGLIPMLHTTLLMEAALAMLNQACSVLIPAETSWRQIFSTGNLLPEALRDLRGPLYHADDPEVGVLRRTILAQYVVSLFMFFFLTDSSMPLIPISPPHGVWQIWLYYRAAFPSVKRLAATKRPRHIQTVISYIRHDLLGVFRRLFNGIRRIVT